MVTLYTITQFSKKVSASKDSVYIAMRKKYKVNTNQELPKKFNDEDVEFYLNQAKEKEKNVEKILSSSKVTKRKRVSKLTDEEVRTAKQRLLDLKDQYNWTLQNCEDLKQEIDNYKKENKTSAVTGGNGSVMMLPQQKQLESYLKLMLNINRSISELENELDMEISNEEDDICS